MLLTVLDRLHEPERENDCEYKCFISNTLTI